MIKREYCFGISIRNKRKTNMDGLLICERAIDGSLVRLSAVCDGVGSTKDGAVASAKVIAEVNDWFFSLQSTECIGTAFLEAMRLISISVSDFIEMNNLSAATTFSAVIVTKERYHIIHLGDSRIYLLGQEGLTQITRDSVNKDGALTSYIGRPDSAFFDYYEGCNSEIAFLLCSDGLYKRLDVEVIEQQLLGISPKRIEQITETLTRLAVENGESDNITISIILNGGWN